MMYDLQCAIYAVGIPTGQFSVFETMPVVYLLILAVAAYLLGSLPFSVWIGKLFFSTDVRNHGSKNPGATNTFRVLGIKAGLPVLILDVLKGYGAVMLVALFEPDTEIYNVILLKLIAGACAFAGHIFPVFAGFKGGKGVATMLGAILAIHIYPALVSIGIFIAVVLLTRYISLGSISGAITYPFSVLLIFRPAGTVMIIFSISVAAIIIITHSKNIRRLINNEESKIRLPTSE